MPAAKAPSLALVCGDDEFAVKQRAKQIYLQWSEELGGMDHEIIEAAVTNSGDALSAIAKLREALNTLPFFGSGKVVWLRDCNFLGEKISGKKLSADLTDTLTSLSDELKKIKWQNIRLLVSADVVDKRKTFFKTLDKIGTVESHDGWSDKDWMLQAGMLARKIIQLRGKEIAENAVAELINRVGPHPRQLESEVEKLCLSVGDRPAITVRDVAAICSQNKMSRAFALGDALGDRDLPALLHCLDEELWEIRLKVDRDKSEIGLLYGLISKVRAMLLLKEMVREGWVRAEADYNRFKLQLERVPKDAFPAEKKFNPLAMHPFVLHRALGQSKNYSRAELVRAMNLLLDGNRRLVSSGLDEALVLQQMLVQIVAPQSAAV